MFTVGLKVLINVLGISRKTSKGILGGTYHCSRLSLGAEVDRGDDTVQYYERKDFISGSVYRKVLKVSDILYSSNKVISLVLGTVDCGYSTRREPTVPRPPPPRLLEVGFIRYGSNKTLERLHTNQCHTLRCPVHGQNLR